MRVRLLVLLAAGVAARAGATPLAPTITEPPSDNRVLNPADVHMEAAGYSDPSGSAFTSTDWEIWKVSPSERVWSASMVTDPIHRVHIHLGDGVFEGSYAGRTQLEFDVAYLLKVRFRNANGEAGPYSQRPFRTSPAGPPGVPGPMPWVLRQAGFAVEVVATGFQLPVNIAFVPNLGTNPTDPFLYVAELYGTIKVVLRNGTVSTYAANLLNFDPTGVFPGSGEQGLAGLAVDPATGDIFASTVYEDTASAEVPKPHRAKVMRFTSADGGHTAATQTTILDMSGERFAESHQISNVSIGPDGKLYVHVGDGFDSSTAQNLESFRGKILRLNLDGSAPADNPLYDGAPFTARDYVYAYGFRNPFGGTWRAADGAHYEVENGPSVDRFAKVVPGRNYLWDGSDASMYNYAIYNWAPPHAPVNGTFIQPGTFSGSGFPFAKMDHAFVTESGPTYAFGPQELGKRIVEFVLDGSGNLASGPATLVEYDGVGRGTAVGLAAGPDGLYFTDLYKDDGSDPIAPGANVLRIRYDPNPPADLSITKTDGRASTVPGTPVTYTITASNAGPNPADGATVTDTLPAAISGATWTCAGSAGGTCSPNGSGSIADTVSLPVGGSVTYTLTGLVAASATGTLVNTATVAVPPGMLDPQGANNSATDSDALTPQADLSITKTDGRSAVLVGQPVTYTIVAGNAGPSAASGARVTDAVPGALSAVSWTCSGAGGGTCAGAGSGSIDDTVSLPAGASVTYSLSGAVGASSARVKNTAAIAAPVGVSDPSLGNNSADDTDVVSCEDLMVVPDGRLAPVTLGAGATITVGASVRIGSGYSVEFKNVRDTSPPGALTMFSGDDACSGTSTLVAPVTSDAEPPGTGGAIRASFVATGTETLFRARLVNGTGGPVTMTVGWSETTLFGPAWSSVGAFDTYLSLLNTTGTALDGFLTWYDTTGAVVAAVSISVPAGRAVSVNTVSLGVPRNRTGTLKLAHLGPPGSLLVEAVIANFNVNPPYVQPVKLQPVRESR